MEDNKKNLLIAIGIILIIIIGFFWFSKSKTTADSICSNPTIKGNISSEGEKIYHEPGQQFYASTVIEASKGEKWFCTEDEATNAGWRKSKK